jgi:hypothetical protein
MKNNNNNNDGKKEDEYFHVYAKLEIFRSRKFSIFLLLPFATIAVCDVKFYLIFIMLAEIFLDFLKKILVVLRKNFSFSTLLNASSVADQKLSFVKFSKFETSSPPTPRFCLLVPRNIHIILNLAF